MYLIIFDREPYYLQTQGYKVNASRPEKTRSLSKLWLLHIKSASYFIWHKFCPNIDIRLDIKSFEMPISGILVPCLSVF